MGYKEFAKAVMTDPTTNVANSTGVDYPALDNKPSSNPTASHKFPEDLWAPGQEPFIYFNIRSTVDPTLQSRGNISLYMPPTIKVNYGAGWDELSMESRKMKALTGLSAGEIAQKLSEGKAMDAILESAKSISSTADAKTIAKYAAQNVIEALPGGSSYASDIRRGMAGKDQVVNPFTSMLYQGPKLRQFQLDFSLYARNQTESESIQKIIKAFKLAMHPDAEKGSQSVFFDFPYVFDVFFITPATDKMFNIKKAALVDLSVDYAGAGAPSFFNVSWAPVDIRMSLTFKELELLTRAEIDQNF
jgi:hypothetical protein